MQAIGVCVSSDGSMVCSELWRSSPGIGSRQKNGSCFPPTWTAQELGKRTNTLRFFGRVFLFFRLQRPQLCGCSAIATQVPFTSSALLNALLLMPGRVWHYVIPGKQYEVR